MPLCYGDDYVYSFIWDGSNGWNIYQPLPEEAKRVESFGDLWKSLSSYYMTWGGRIIGTVLSQFFLWKGKELFNVCNSVVFLFLILEIYYISIGGNLTAKLNSFRLLWIFFALWTFVLGFNGIAFWLVGSCYYLWTMVIVLGFLLPYVKRFMEEGRIGNGKGKALWMFPAGILAGCTNENMICWLILFLGIYCWKEYKGKRLLKWMMTGWTGLVLGYVLLILSPGNLTRIFYDVESTEMQTLESKLLILVAGFMFQFLLWYFIGGVWRNRNIFGKDEQVQRLFCLIMAGSIGSAGMLLIMLLSPEFPLRSLFPSTVFLIITAAWVLELARRTGKSFLQPGARKFLRVAGAGYMIWTMSVTALAIYDTSVYADEVNEAARSMAASNSLQILELPHREADSREIIWSGVHNTPSPLKTDVNHWNNVAYARYWGIEGVKMKE